MNLSDWESRLVTKQRLHKQAVEVVEQLETDIADCIVNIETKRRREAVAKKKAGRRPPKALADVTKPGKEIDGTKI